MAISWHLITSSHAWSSLDVFYSDVERIVTGLSGGSIPHSSLERAGSRVTEVYSSYRRSHDVIFLKCGKKRIYAQSVVLALRPLWSEFSVQLKIFCKSAAVILVHGHIMLATAPHYHVYRSVILSMSSDYTQIWPQHLFPSQLTIHQSIVLI
jgi:hypothetical protein